MVKLAVVGAGAFGEKHVQGLAKIEGVEVACLVDHRLEPARAMASQYGIGEVVSDLSEVLQRVDIGAVILCTPSHMHAAQASACLAAGKHVQVEIPLGVARAEIEQLVALQGQTKLIAMVGHTRRFNPSHQYMHRRFAAGTLRLQQMNVQTYFFRRTNINAMGQPRSWTDHLLWHHAAHTVDLFAYQAGPITNATAVQGPVHPTLGIAMDMSIQLKASNGAICSLSLSFNNDGPLGSVFRYICDGGTWIANYDDLLTGYSESVDLSSIDISMNGIELQDREFVSAIRELREPNASIRQVVACYRVLGGLEEQLKDA